MQGPREEVALEQIAAAIGQIGQLFFGLDTLGNGAHVQRLGQRDDGIDNGRPIAVAHLGDKALVYFQGVDGKAPQIAQR